MKLVGRLKTSHEGLMIGNGTLGALIYGENKLTVSLDRIDLWDLRNPPEYLDPEFDYPHLVKYLNEDLEKAYKLFDESYNHPFPTKINAGIISFDFNVSDADSSEINPFVGEVTYQSKNNSLVGYVDAQKDVIVLNFAKKPNHSISMAPYFSRPIEKRGLGYRKEKVIRDGDFTFVIQKTYGEHHFHIALLEDGESLFITIRKGTNIKRSKKYLLSYAQNKEKNLKAHRKYYERYFSTSSVLVPNQRMQDIYDIGRYYLACNSRHLYPMTLHGVWTQNNGNLPPWKADLHNDINVQMSYESYLKNGNVNEGKVLLDYLWRHMPQFRENARSFCKTKGAYIPGVMSQAGLPLGGWPQYAMNPCCQIWLIKSFDEYYSYSSDRTYLSDVVFSVFSEIETSIFEMLIKDKDGYYELGFHSSPEFFENDQKSLFATQTNFELTMLRYLYSKLSEYCRVLGKDDTHYMNVLAHLRKDYRDENGCLMVSKDHRFDMSHRHFSHMLSYKNMKLVDPFSHEKEIEEDIRHLASFGTDEWVGFSYVEYAGLNALIRKGDEAMSSLSIFADHFTHPNGFHMNNDFKEHKYSKMDCYVMTLEANMGYVNSMNDCMVQTYGNKLCIFPAISKEFGLVGCSFENLRVEGGHKISGKVQENNVSFTISFSCPAEIEIYNNFKDDPTLIIDGKHKCFLNKKGSFIHVKANHLISFED